MSAARSGVDDARLSEHPPPRHVLAHISDPHFVGGTSPLLHGVVDSRRLLMRLLAQLEGSGVPPQALVFTGDLADLGEADAYRSLRAAVQPAADRMGAQVVWVMGNHDDRAQVRTQLMGEQGSAEPIDRVVWLDGLRVVVLDTSVPGSHHGELTTSQLSWLRGVLARAAPEGTILAMHHPPVPCLQDGAVAVELRGQAPLAAVLRGTDVRSILAGHLHFSTSATFAGIPVSVAGSTCYTQDLMTPRRGTRGRDGGQGFHLVHVYDETIMHSMVPLGRHQTVGASDVSPSEQYPDLRVPSDPSPSDDRVRTPAREVSTVG
ncbi:metallophosphoesterase [Actinotalea sp. K2]|uniref:metallophosphoesterase n=1 Tax=Actinotalea sp. K2 TaxID=2939438 RepID=UPI0024B510F0|nr:metallophosphoesterase [Actinotalea sp. K2]